MSKAEKVKLDEKFDLANLILDWGSVLFIISLSLQFFKIQG